MRKVPCYCLLFCMSILMYTHVQGQAGLKKASNKLEKGEFDKLKKLLNKSMDKDSSNVGAKYLYARLYLDERFEGYSLDTSYAHILAAKRDYKASETKTLKKLAQLSIDSLSLEQHQQQVDSLAFQWARLENTEESYNRFLSIYTTSRQQKEARILRNAKAYENALAENSSAAYLYFINTYPKSLQAKAAKKAYDLELFRESTVDRSLNSYVQFLHENPNSQQKSKAEEQIFQLSTSIPSTTAYLSFAAQYPKSSFARKSIDYLYHMLKDNGQENELPKALISDSLRHIISLEERPLVLTYEQGRFGFMDDKGIEVLPHRFHKVKEAYHCSTINDAYLEAGDERLLPISRNGDAILKQAYDKLTDMGVGLLRFERSGKKGVVHLNGDLILPCMHDEILLTEENFLLFKKGGQWGMSTFAGRVIVKPYYETIESIAGHMVFGKGGKYAVHSPSTIFKALKEGGFTPSLLYSHLSMPHTDVLWTQKTGEHKTYIWHRDKEHHFASTSQPLHHEAGHVLQDGNTFRLVGKDTDVWSAGNMDSLHLHYPWLWVQRDSIARFYHLKLKDSLSLLGDASFPLPGCLLIRTEEKDLFFLPSGAKVQLPPSAKCRLVRMPITDDNEMPYFLWAVTEENRTYIYDKNGKSIHVSKSAPEIKAIGNYLCLDRGGKKGLINLAGETLLDIRYDAIGNFKEGYVSVLSRGRFGLFHEENDIFIRPSFTKNIQAYGNKGHLFIAHRNGGFGLINKQGNTVVPFDYEEIRFWNDSSALVKKEYEWRLYDIQNNDYLQTGIKNLFFDNGGNNNEDNITAVVLIDNKYGVMSNTKGFVIPASFDDILNLGSKKAPIYFAEKRVEEAGMHVLLYYNGDGEIIKKQALESDAYLRLYCEDY